MSKAIIYKNSDGDVSVVYPMAAALAGRILQEIAEKDVPAGLAYKIVDEADVPSDRTFRGAWTIADSELTDGTGGDHDMFIDDPAHPNYVAPVGDDAV